MVRGEYEKTIRISAIPKKNVGIQASYSDGQKQAKVTKPKSLTPKAPLKSPSKSLMKKK